MSWAPRAWPFGAFVAGQALIGASLVALFGWEFAAGWWGLWLVGAGLIEVATD